MREVAHISSPLKNPPSHKYIEMPPAEEDSSPFQAIYKNEPRAGDPLWERVCTEVIHLMGLGAQPIRKCSPESISHKEK